MAIWDSLEFDDHEQVCFFSDGRTGLRAIVALHSTALGPAAGGTRFKPYADDALALNDALRLSRAMSYKSALAGLPVGGGKSVIIGDPAIVKTRELLLAYGRFIDRIGQNYATGEDIGITVADMDTIRQVTPYVGGTSAGAGDPSIHTATGVVHALNAIAEHRFERDGVAGLRVAIQGLGAVGWRVAERLHRAGAMLVVADVDAGRVARAVAELGAVAVPTGTIHAADVDIFCPCALGGVVTTGNVDRITASVVAGSANNQLASREAGWALHRKGVLFAPDFVVNAGGIISGLEATRQMPHREQAVFQPLDIALAAIRGRLLSIFARAADEHRPPEVTAEAMACELIGRKAPADPSGVR